MFLAICLLKGLVCVSGHIKSSGASGCPSLLLFLCLFSRSTDNDDATKRKVNLVFEKIQTLKSRAAGSAQGSHQVSWKFCILQRAFNMRCDRHIAISSVCTIGYGIKWEAS